MNADKQTNHESNMALTVLAKFMIFLSLATAIFCAYIEYASKDYFYSASTYWLALTWSISMLFFILFIIIAFYVENVIYLKETDFKGIWPVFLITILSFTALLLGVWTLVEHKGATWHMCVSFCLTGTLWYFDRVVLEESHPICTNSDKWKKLFEEAKPLDLTITITFILLFALCFAFEIIYRPSSIQPISIQAAADVTNHVILIFSAGASAALMSISTGVFAYGILSKTNTSSKPSPTVIPTDPPQPS